MKVFLDANILFSGALPDSRMRALLLVLAKHAECLTNSYAIEEARRNLELKFPTSVARLPALIDLCAVCSLVVDDLPVELNTKDRPILGGAIAAAATHLVTGDKTDFGHLFGKTICGVKVVSPTMLAEELVALGLLARAR
jgi:uncharacterized protein